MANVKHYYKFQALITLQHGGSQDAQLVLGSTPHRMVVRGLNEDTHRSQVFTALVSCDEGPLRPRGDRLVATLRLAGDDVTNYVSIGRHFDLWLGRKIGEGIITRRLFV